MFDIRHMGHACIKETKEETLIFSPVWESIFIKHSKILHCLHKLYHMYILSSCSQKLITDKYSNYLVVDRLVDRFMHQRLLIELYCVPIYSF